MSRPTPRTRRPPASRPRTIALPADSPHPVSAHELITKRRGELAELAFTLKATSLGFAVSKPYGDSERYDFILDPRALAAPPPQPVTPSSKATGRAQRSARTVERRHSSRLPPAKQAGERSDPALTVEGPWLPTMPELPPSRQRLANTAPAPLHRVQVKCSTQLLNGLYHVNAHRRTNGRAVPYHPSEIDFLVAYIIPEDTWYILPLAAIRSRTGLLFRRHDDPKPGLYDHYREAWHLLRPKAP